jgi:hypothetical protein
MHRLAASLAYSDAVAPTLSLCPSCPLHSPLGSPVPLRLGRITKNIHYETHDLRTKRSEIAKLFSTQPHTTVR